MDNTSPMDSKLSNADCVETSTIFLVSLLSKKAHPNELFKTLSWNFRGLGTFIQFVFKIILFDIVNLMFCFCWE